MPALHLLPGPFTLETYHRLGQLGILDEDDRVELLDGQIVEMTPIGPGHGGAVNSLTRILSTLVQDRAVVSVQNPLVLEAKWEPQPDVTLLKPRADYYRNAHPRPADVILVIEVADTSLERDRDVKIPRYAAAGIPEAWLVDLNDDSILVCREPRADGYAKIVTVRRDQALEPIALPGVTISPSSILG